MSSRQPCSGASRPSLGGRAGRRIGRIRHGGHLLAQGAQLHEQLRIACVLEGMQALGIHIGPWE
eukprot:8810485-Alexandrium_andersonii.AAC.1